MNIAAWLVAMVGPLMARWVASMGLSLVSLVGLTAAYATLKAMVVSKIGGLPSEAIALGGLLGIWTSLGIMLGALVFVMTWKSTATFWTLAKA